MKKQEAILIFGNRQIHLAKAVGKTNSAISQWPERLNKEQVALVLGAAVINGKNIPVQFIGSQNDK